MNRCVLAAVLLTVTACSPLSLPPQGDAGVATDAATTCTHDEDCAELGPYGYCRIFPDEGESVGVCVRD